MAPAGEIWGAVCRGGQGTQAGAQARAQGAQGVVCTELASLWWGGDPKESPLSSHWLGGQACCLLCGSLLTPPPFWAEEPHLEPWRSGCLRGQAGELATAARRVTVLAHAEPAQGLGPLDGRCWIQAAPPLPRDVRRKPAVPAPGGLTSEDTWPGRFTSHRVCATLS